MLNTMMWKNRIRFIQLVFASLMLLPLEAYAARIIASVTLNGARKLLGAGVA
jgi:hypothetical protein